MEEFSVRKKSRTSRRRPRPDSQSLSEGQDHSPPLSSTPPSDDLSKVSSDENAGGDANSRRKEFNLNQYSRVSTDGGFNAFNDDEAVRNGSNSKRSSKGVLAPANWKSTSKGKECLELESRDGEIQSSVQGASIDSNESKVKKVKLRVGGVTRTIHANKTTNGLPGPGSSARKNNLQGSMDDGHSPPDLKSSLQGVPWKDFNKVGFGKEGSLMGKTSGKNIPSKQGDHAGMVRKSKRAPKRRLLGDFSDDDNDDEIRYLEKLKTSKISPAYKEYDDELGKKQKKISTISNTESFGTSKFAKDDKRKHKSDIVSEDNDYEEGAESVSDIELEGSKKKKQRKELVDASMESKKEITLTTRQRALLSSKDSSSAPGSSLIEFPNGLPPAPSRKQKEKLSEVEQQLKKTEAAQRRRMQVEKANRESEAEAIRKILGQDSSRKKREDKIKKRQEEMAQEKAVNADMLASNIIRLVMGPAGTTVTFPRDLGFPTIFDSKPSSYPAPRENCAGPSCANPYKYRDSKSKLPLCSLQCYKAVQEQLLAETTC